MPLYVESCRHTVWTTTNFLVNKIHDSTDVSRYNTQVHSFLGVDYCCLVAKQYIYIAAESQNPFFTPYLEFLKNKLKIDENKIPGLGFCLSALSLGVCLQM